jgi:aspartate kinase
MSIVMKFGGTSVQDADEMRQVGRIIARRIDQKPLVVVSALAGVTQSLIDAAHGASMNGRKHALDLLAMITARHFAIAEELLENRNNRKMVIRFLRRGFSEIRELLESICILQETTPRSIDRISGYGELLSSFLLEAYLEECGLNAIWVDARKILITDNNFGMARPLTFFSFQRVWETLVPLLQQGTIPVIQGYIGATAQGIPTTLGRGSSDDSAAIFGNLLNAKEIQIWTDVCGILTADPNIDPSAQTIRELSYTEASRLSAAGAKVLHLGAIAWAAEKRISIRILNTFDPHHHGTTIQEYELDALAVNNSRNLSAACE